MRVVVSGSTGLIGSALVDSLRADQHCVLRLVRTPEPAGEDEVPWAPADDGLLDPDILSGADAVVHLGGTNIAQGRWTAARKRDILDSRVVSTQLLAESMTRATAPPRVWVCASAIGYYGDRGDETLTEDSDPGTGFLAQVCDHWEAATAAAARAGVRVVNARFGVVLSPQAGALAKMLRPFKLGAGGPLGHGRQYMSWVALDDAVGAVRHAIENEGLRGPVNVVAPESVTNRAFAKTLGEALSKPAVMPAPGFALRLALGEMARELLLASTRVEPTRLLASGYGFRYPTVDKALREMLN
ncbi:MAG: TIGR01777 family protein [bacterium]|nr:TIGR01777 family protein [bacterium]